MNLNLYGALLKGWQQIGGGKVPFQRGKHVKGKQSKNCRAFLHGKHMRSLRKRQAQRNCTAKRYG